MFGGGNDTGAERAGIEERYETACSATSLHVRAEKGGAADLMIAAGWSDSRIGTALLRLHSEWTGAAKPKRLGPAQIAALAVQHRDKKGIPNKGKAKAEAERWYAAELVLLAQSLKSRPSVWSQLLPWAQSKRIPEHEIAQALFHWLDPVCSHCDGHGLHKAKDAPALSGVTCKECKGTGQKRNPNGTMQVLSYISHCTSQARTSIAKRLRPGG